MWSNIEKIRKTNEVLSVYEKKLFPENNKIENLMNKMKSNKINFKENDDRPRLIKEYE